MLPKTFFSLPGISLKQVLMIFGITGNSKHIHIYMYICMKFQWVPVFESWC